MSAPTYDGTPMTKQEVLIARRAFLDGCMWENSTMRNHGHPLHGADAVLVAESRYPLPKTTRPRVVPDPHTPSAWWFIADGDITLRTGAVTLPWNVWAPDGGYRPTPERVALWADLLANPVEECDADE